MKKAFILSCIAFRNMFGTHYSRPEDIKFECELVRELLK